MILAREITEVEHYGRDGTWCHVICHRGVALQMKIDTPRKSGVRHTLRCRTNCRLLNIKCEHPAAFPDASSEKHRVMAVSCGGIDHPIALLNRTKQERPCKLSGSRRKHRVSGQIHDLHIPPPVFEGIDELVVRSIHLIGILILDAVEAHGQGVIP